VDHLRFIAIGGNAAGQRQDCSIAERVSQTGGTENNRRDGGDTLSPANGDSILVTDRNPPLLWGSCTAEQGRQALSR